MLRGNIDALWAESFWTLGASRRGMESALRAMADLPQSHQFARGVASTFFALSLQKLGQIAKARQFLDQELEQLGETVNAYGPRLLLSLMLVLLDAGEYRELAQFGSHVHRLAAQVDNPVLQAWACFATGAACYEMNDLDRAAEFFARGIELRYRAHIIAASHCFVGLALTQQAKAQSAEANATAAAQYEFHAMQQLHGHMVASRALYAHLNLLQCDLERAAHWARIGEQNQFLATWHMMVLPVLTHAAVLLAEGTPESVRQAADEAQQLWLNALDANSRRGQSKVLALQALIHDAQGMPEASRVALERCVALLQPNGAIRTFVDLGPRMAALLRELREKGVARDYLSHVLAAFPAPPTADDAETASRLHQAEPGAHGDADDMIAPLTRRETEVLSQLVQHRTNKEIAQALFISELTVKIHTRNIYKKLAVKGRMAAARRASALGLVSRA
jgi:LuxR family maltose regulon positive regulatory protein